MGNRANQPQKLEEEDPVPSTKNGEPTKESAAEQRAMEWKAVKALLPYLWPKGEPGLKARTVFSLTFLILSKVFNVLVPQVFKYMINFLDPKDPSILIVMPTGLIIMYGVLRLLSRAAVDIQTAIFLPVQLHAIRSASVEAFTHLHKLSMQFHVDRRTGGVLRGIDRATKAIQFVLEFVVFTIGPILLELGLVVTIMLASYEAWFAVITFITVGAYTIFTFLITEWRTKFRKAMNEKDNELNNKAIDSLINFETVRYFSNEEHEISRYNQSLVEYSEASVKSQLSLALLNIGQALFIAVGVTGVLWLAAWRLYTQSSEMTMGDFVAINNYILQLYVPLSSLGSSYRMVKQATVDLEQMFRMSQTALDIQDSPLANDIEVTKGEIRFSNVHFQYKQDGRKILDDVSFHVLPGQMVAFVGPSGAGKTSVSRLLYRLYDKQKGSITIDDQEITEVTQASVRRAIGIVPQDCVLFNDTIEYNIRYGKVTSTDEDVRNAARLAKIHDFIEALPLGYQTKVGERGLRLSGGEKQRVAIARAILKDPHIMIFDEATSALDSKTEQEIQASLQEVSVGRTTVVVAHRLSTIIGADQIFVLKDGHIKERGTHEELLAIPDGEYLSMWLKQQEKIEPLAGTTSPPPLGKRTPSPAGDVVINLPE